MYLIDLFKAHGCAFNSLSESIDTSSASGRMFLKMIGIFAEFERENIGERVRLGKERKAKEGFTMAAGKVSYGYDKDNGEKVQRINETETAVVRRMFDMYINQNVSLNGIAKTLNRENIPSKCGSVWGSTQVKSVLLNCNLIGNVRYAMHDPDRNFEVEGKHEAIISEEDYQKAKSLLEKNQSISPTKRPVDDNYFSGALFCGICGKRLTTHVGVAYSKGEKLAKFGFQCQGALVGICNAKAISAKKFEKVLIEYFSKLTFTPDTEQETTEAEAKRLTAARIEVLQEKLSMLDEKEKEMLDSYIENTATLAEYRGVKDKLDGERVRITAELERIMPPSERRNIEGAISPEEIAAMFRENWGGYSNAEKRRFVVNHIKKVVIINKPKPGNQKQGIYNILDVEYHAD
jgi:site-specific DNA recombinase